MLHVGVVMHVAVAVWRGCMIDAALVCCCCLQCYFALLLILFAAKDEGSKLGMLIAICGGGFFVRLLCALL